jgi:hypothetical protein
MRPARMSSPLGKYGFSKRRYGTSSGPSASVASSGLWSSIGWPRQNNSKACRKALCLPMHSTRVLLTNAAAKAMLDTRDGLFLENGRLAAAGGPDVLQKLIATCARGICAVDGPGGEFKIPREFPRSPLHVTVTPLRSEARLADIPWIGTEAPVALVTVKDPEIDRRRETNLRRRFGLTAVESRLAAEIVKGDGRVAAARRRGISGGRPPKPSSQKFSRRPGPTGWPNSSASWPTMPTGRRWKHERFRR